jgi:AraC family ethanolamine operon transcriptional activator
MITATFRDFDAFKDAVRDVDCTMIMHSPKHRKWTIDRVFLPDVHVQFGRLGSGNIVEGQAQADGFLLYLPLSGSCVYSANGVFLPEDSFMVLEPGCTFSLTSSTAHNWCTVFVPTHEISRAGRSLNTCWVTAPNQRMAYRLRSAVGDLLDAAGRERALEFAPAARCAQKEFLEIAAAVAVREIFSKPQPQGRPVISRRQIIDKCIESIERRPDVPKTVTELARIANVSERTLRSAFNQYYGVGPNQYLQLRQMNRVHRALKKADPDARSVSEIYVENGVWQFGRFSSRYRRLFGELPSETLQRV